MSDHRREISVHKRLATGEMQKLNAVALQDVAGELCIGEGNGMPQRPGVAGRGRSCRNCNARCRRW
jgi:hypothetical protein